MELRFTDVARRHMALLGVHRLEVEAIIADFARTETGPGLVAYYGESGGRTLVVIVVEDSDPPFVVSIAEG
jgi:hypothetical protein